MRKKLLATLALLLMAATGAKAQYFIVTFGANGNTLNKGVTFTFDDKTGLPCYKFECNESGNGELDNIMKTLDNRWTKCQKDETPTSSGYEFITAGLNEEGCLCITIRGAHDAPTVVEGRCYDVDGVTPFEYKLEIRCTDPSADINVTAHEGAPGEYWATYYSSAWDYKADANTTVYQAAVNSGRTAVVLTEVTDKYIPKAQAVILKSSAPTITLSQPSCHTGVWTL